MVSLYFGLPGAGKTTMMAAIMYDAVRKQTYRNVYCNITTTLPGVTVIDNECIGKYNLEDALICIDEATLFADSRDHKNFGRDLLEYFLEHRHYNVDIFLFTQQWDGVDRKIRVITEKVFYIYKGIFTGHWYSRCYRVPYGIIIPDPKVGGEKLGEIIQGYCKPGIFQRLFGYWCYRPRYYKYFDSWERKELPPLPRKYKKNPYDWEKTKCDFTPWFVNTAKFVYSCYSEFFRAGWSLYL